MIELELNDAVRAIRAAVERVEEHVDQSLRVILAAQGIGTDDEFVRAAILLLLDDIRDVDDDLRLERPALAGDEQRFRDWARRRPGGAVDLDRCGPEVVEKLRAEFEAER